MNRKYLFGTLFLIALVVGWNLFQSNDEEVVKEQKPSKQTEQTKTQTASTAPVRSNQSGFSTPPFWSGGATMSGITTTGSYQRIPFIPPNTEWAPRTLSGITYVFGEGNPKEVALTYEQIKEIGKKCESHDLNDVLYKEEFCNPETERLKYLYVDAEKHVMAALSDPNWKKLATECEGAFRSLENADTFENARDNPNFPHFDRVFSSGFLDIENFISIDPVTGWKRLNTGRANGLSEFLMQATHDGYKNPTEWRNPYGDCVDRYATEIVRNLEIAVALYISPVDFPNGTYSGWLDSKEFSIPHH